MAEIKQVKIGSTNYDIHAKVADSISGVTATTTELNYVDGVTSNIQTQLNSLADDIATRLPLNNESSTALAQNTDLDTIKTVGVYTAVASTGSTLINSPVTSGQKLIVLQGYSDARRHQFIFGQNTSNIFHRMYGGSSWTDWVNLSKTTLGDLGITATATELNYMDGVTSNVQTQLNGKAASSHGTHVTFTTTKPAAAGTASVGSATTVSRSDHVHPAQTSISGNAATSDKAKALMHNICTVSPLEFANSCPVGLTYFFTNSDTPDLPSDDYIYGTGYVMKRSEKFVYIELHPYNLANAPVARNTRNNDDVTKWYGWVYGDVGSLPITGGTITGTEGLTIDGTNVTDVAGFNFSLGVLVNDSKMGGIATFSTNQAVGMFVDPVGSIGLADLYSGQGICYKYGNNYHLGPSGVYSNGSVLYGAAWNDYAEYRSQKEEIKPGYCVASADNGQVYKTTEKFQACDGIVSDTFGFAIGETEECKTPLAVAGRVLAYCEGNRYDYHSGDTVCAGPNGKVCKMTREEIKEYPDRIVGIVSEIPEYETWGTGEVEVNGRIWIKVR